MNINYQVTGEGEADGWLLAFFRALAPVESRQLEGLFFKGRALTTRSAAENLRVRATQRLFPGFDALSMKSRSSLSGSKGRRAHKHTGDTPGPPKSEPAREIITQHLLDGATASRL